MKYTRDVIQKAVSSSISVAEVLRTLNIKLSGGMHRHISKRIKEFDIDTSHFKPRESFTRKAFRIPLLKPEEILIKSRVCRREKKYILKRALLESGIKEVCLSCGISKWMDKPIKLHIEHKDGDYLNNEIDNLCFLCPNCHSQTPTYSTMKKNL